MTTRVTALLGTEGEIVSWCVNILEDNTSVYVWKGGQVCIPY